ncbi:hypothetical protein S83_055903 [Arachis hypogaea]
MEENSSDVFNDCLHLRDRCFFFFNRSLHPLPPWQLKKKTVMACCCVPFRHRSNLLHFRVTASSSSTRRCVSSASLVPWQHLVATSPSTMTAPYRCIPFCHDEEEDRKCRQSSLRSSELSSDYQSAFSVQCDVILL